MADMDETGQPTAFEEDPAAAFLAREQDELADIADDTFGFTPGASEVSQNLSYSGRGCASFTDPDRCFRLVSLCRRPSIPEKVCKMKETSLDSR